MRCRNWSAIGVGLILLAAQPSLLFGADKKTEYLKLRRLIGRERFHEAIERCKQLTEVYPDYLYLYETLPEVGQYAGELPNVIRYFEGRIEEGSEIAYAYFGLGCGYYYMKDYQAAVLSLSKAVELGMSAPECYKSFEYAYEKLEGVDAAIRFFNSRCHRNPENANYWYASALAYWSKKDYAKVLRNIDEAIRSRPSESKYSILKAAVLLWGGDRKRCVELISTLLPLAELRADFEDAEFLRSFLVLADFQINHWAQGTATAQKIARESIDYGLLRWHGWALMRLADAEFYTGNYMSCLVHTREVLKSAERARESDLAAAALASEFRAYFEFGDFQSALESAFKRLRLCRAEGFERGQSRALSDIAMTYHELEADDAAIEYAVEALNRAESSVSDPDLLFHTHNVLGIVNSGLGRHQLALNHYRLAFELVPEKYSWANNFVVSHGLLGEAYSKLGEFGKAKVHLLERLFLARKKGFKGLEACALGDLGNLYCLMGEYALARRYYEQSRAMARSLAQMSVVQMCARGLGRLAEVAGKLQEALEWYQEVIDNRGYVNHSEGSSFIYGRARPNYTKDQNNLIRILCALHRTQEAFEVAERAKIQKGLNQIAASERRMNETADSSKRIRVLQIKSELERKYFDLARESSRRFVEGNMDRSLTIRSDIEDLEQKYLKILDSAKTNDALLSYQDKRAGIATKRIQDDVLARDEALLEYVVGDRQTEAFVLTRDTLAHFTIRKTRGELSDMLTRISEALGDGGRYDHIWNAALANFDVTGCIDLYRLLVKPAEEVLKGVNRLIIVPDGLLKRLPFEVLVADAPTIGPSSYSTAHFLVECYEVSYAIAASFLSPNTYGDGRSQKVVLALGNPTLSEYDRYVPGKSEGVEREPAKSGSFRPLPGVKKEVDGIKQVFGQQCDVLLKEGASKAIFKQLAPEYQILHIAAHGIFDNEQPMYSSINLTSDTKGDEKGGLQAFELLNLELNADLAVLSACNSGRGQKGEGMDGLVSAFMFAGVPSVVSTLWSVEDESTAGLMASFYSYLKRGERKSRALQLAKLDAIKSGNADPFYWAAFVLLGDASPLRLPDSSAVPAWIWPTLVSLLVIVAAITCHYLWLRSRAIDLAKIDLNR